MKVLEISNLRTQFRTQGGIVQAVRGINLHLDKGEMIGIVGESGSGKTVSMLSLMGLLAENGSVTEGEIVFDGKSISPIGFPSPSAYEKAMQDLRCNRISMIFQDPMTYLNPILTVGTQLTEPIRLHMGLSRKEALARAIELMKVVGIPSPEKRLKQYPFEFSGGMRQRIIIAIAISCNPEIIIADEPTTALDVTIQAQILDLIKELKQKMGTSVIMISHDLGVVATTCTRVIIMYGGKIVEEGTNRDIFNNPKHPYTIGLLNSINDTENPVHKELKSIPGSPPDLLAPPAGCPFVDRCEKAMWICKDRMPPRVQYSDVHAASCWLEHPYAKAENAGANHA